ncbi:hypothetical protein [Cytobacillus oceanisediminis]|uniref:hypothetical protein n=1 Tax=Cytobacillus oceanisediminis TaxID=665099 RepID=UPI0020793C64|nr:hypothetical protein [Cytobacillus oceanisediminis]USK43749.1 hypothetical protein LIT27_24745 [Cytobacillus oceanisediminis]
MLKKIQLSDGMPVSISKNELKSETSNLLCDIKALCAKSGLSYVEVNKALHLADEELYRFVVNSSIQVQSK